MKTGVELIAEERQRQIKEEGYTEQHDSQHDLVEFIKASIAYLVASCDESDSKRFAYGYAWWPWDMLGWKPEDIERNLVKSGALIAAAIDKLQKEKIC